MYQPQYRTPSASSPAPQAEQAATSESVIDRNSHFDGLYTTSQDLRIEGIAEGEIQCDGTVTIAEDATIIAKVRARNVIIAGSAEGEIVCLERFTLQPSGEIRGKVRAASLIIEEGAFFEGEFQMADEGNPPEFGGWNEEAAAPDNESVEAEAPAAQQEEAAEPTAAVEEESETELMDDGYGDEEDEEDDAFA